MSLQDMPQVVEHRFDAKSDSKAPILSYSILSPVGCSNNVPGTCIRTLMKEFKNIECSLNRLSNTRTCASQRKSQTYSWVSNICGAQDKSIKRHSHIMCLNI